VEENNQYDVDKAQKYAYYYQNENSYYNQNTPNSKSSQSSVGGIIAIPFVVALFMVFKYILTILLVPAIPAMFAGYKVSLLLSNPNTVTKLLFILFFGFLGIVLQLGLIRVFIDYIFKHEWIKWILFILFYGINLYLIFFLAENYPVKDIINTKRTLVEIYSYILSIL